MALRIVFAVQIAWVAFVGALSRAWLDAVAIPDWLEQTAYLGLMPGWPVFPIAVGMAAWWSKPREWELWVIVLGELGLCFAAFLAILPAVS